MKSADELTKRLEELKQALGQCELQQSQLELIEVQIDKLSDLVTSSAPAGRSLRELKGLGKENWHSIDVEDYLREERRSWR